MKARVGCIAILLSLAAIPALAAAADLPPEDQVRAALDKQPAVVSARALLGVESANRLRLSAGPHETSIRLGAQQRSVSPDRYGEWDIAMERSLRLPGKARVDEALGAHGEEQARIAVAGAVQESARNLVRLWFAWLRQGAQAAEWREQLSLLERQLAVVQRRMRAGDAAPLEQGLAQAAVAQARSSLLQAEGRAAVAANELAASFPELRLEPRPALAIPEALDGAVDTWRSEVLRYNQELAFARADVRRADLMAERADAERMPDPTLGVRYGSERAGAERIVCLSVAIPLPGQGRAANAQAAAAQARAAAAREAAVLRKLEAEITNSHAQARSSHETWRMQQQAAEGMQSNAELLAKAYGLGESSLAEVLNARRLAAEARLAATLAQADAREAHTLLVLHAGRLWPFDAAFAEGTR